MDRDEPHEWLVGFLHCPAVVQITLSSVKLHPSLVRTIALKLYGVPPSFNHLTYSVLPKCACILLKINFHTFYGFEVTLCFYCRHFVSSWNQTSILLQVFCQFLEPNRHFILKIISNIHGSFIYPNYSQTMRLYCI